MPWPRLTWKSGGSTALSGVMSLITGVPVAMPFGLALDAYPVPLFQTAAGQALVLNLGGAVQVSGHLTYILQASP